MLQINDRRASPRRLRRLEQDYTAEEWLEIELLFRPIIILQEHPDIALKVLSGLKEIPPHQRWLLYQLHRGAGENVVVASRGTSKSSSVCVMYTGYRLLLTRNHHAVTLSATGFRGGQMIFDDTDRWFRGGWDSQEVVPGFFLACLKDGKVNRSQNFWSYALGGSTNRALPTRDEDAIRGVRANVLLIDEANTTEQSLIDKVAEPFLAVKGDFEHGGKNAEQNQIFYTTTIDYGWRPFIARMEAAYKACARDYAHFKALEAGDIARAVQLESQGHLDECTFTRFDYTDLLIREELVNRRGERFRVKWPNPKIELEHDPLGIPFTAMDQNGYVLKDGPPVSFYRTYPLDKRTLERSLRAGSVDEASWLSEQRNIVDTAAGDVYPNALVDQVTCIGEHVIAPYDDYAAPVLWKCADPCVMGVDYAPQSDFCAFVIIRIGPLARGEYDPEVHMGETRWSNVIWAEQHRKMTHKQAADKIRALMTRYNIVSFRDQVGNDPLDACRGIGLDMRGSGEGVANDLVYLNEGGPPPGGFRIYDPNDKDDRRGRFDTDTSARPILDAIWPSDVLNETLVEFTLGQMQQAALYIGKYLDVSSRPKGQRELHIGYDAMRLLDSQLRKVRQEPTQSARRFFMSGDRAKDSNKKDLFSAFLYASKQVRAHLLRQAQIDNALPAMMSRVVPIRGPRRNNGRVPGSRR